MLLYTLKKEFYCAFHISKFSYHFISRFLGKGRERLRGTSRESDCKETLHTQLARYNLKDTIIKK